MSRSKKFAKQAANGRRPFTSNLRRALSGMNLAVVPDDEPAVSRPATETIQDRVARLRKHLAVYENDGDARTKYQELTGLPWGVATETLSNRAPLPDASTYARPEFLGIGGGQRGNCEVYIPGDEERAGLTEAEWLILAQAAQEGVFIQEGIIPEKRE